MTAQPKTIATDLFDKLENWIVNGLHPTTFELKKLEREADALMRVAADEASIVKAGLAAIVWDVDKALYFVDNACRLDPSESTLLNSALTCRFMNLYPEAIAYGRRALAIAPNSSKAASHTLEYLMGCGDLEGARQLLAPFEQRGQHVSSDIEALRQISEFIEVNGVSESHLKAELEIAIAVLTAHKIRASGMQWSRENDPDGGDTYVITMYFKGDLSTELELESELAQKFADLENWNPNLLSIEFRYELTDDLQPA